MQQLSNTDQMAKSYVAYLSCGHYNSRSLIRTGSSVNDILSKLELDESKMTSEKGYVVDTDEIKTERIYDLDNVSEEWEDKWMHSIIHCGHRVYLIIFSISQITDLNIIIDQFNDFNQMDYISDEEESNESEEKLEM